MKRFIPVIAALAALAMPSIASADVLRCGSQQTGTLAIHVGHLTDPASESTHFYPNVTVDANAGTFTGTDGYGRWTTGGETISGTIKDGVITSFTATMFNGNYVWTYDPTQVPTWQGFDGYQRFSVDSIDLQVTDAYNNHGQFVKAQGGGKVAALACNGMPVNSTQGS